MDFAVNTLKTRRKFIHVPTSAIPGRLAHQATTRTESDDLCH